MKTKRVIKVGDKVRFEHQSFVNTRICRIKFIIRQGSLYGTDFSDGNDGALNISRRQIHSVFVKKKKVEHEEFWINEYWDQVRFNLSNAHATRMKADQECRGGRTSVMHLRVIERIKC